MNRIYRVVWSKARHAWVVASELAKSCGKSRGRSQRAASRTPLHEQRLAMGAWPLRTAIVTILLAHVPARAADRYWDVNDTDVGLGGAGTWDLTNPIWGADDDGVSGPYRAWNNAALDDAFFTGTAATVTVATPVTVHNLNFLVHNYVLDGGTLNLALAGTAPTIHAPGNTTINSIIAGTAGLTKTGGGSLTLTGTNTFSGGIFLEGGTLSADDNAALGAAGNVITTRANTSVGFAVGTGPVNRTVAIGSGGTVTVTGAAGQARYTGNGNVSVAAGSMLSNDANIYTGTTRFSGCSGICTSSFTSIADLGIASSLGAPTTVANGTITFTSAAQYSDNLVYLGDGDSSNRNWSIGGSAAVIHNQGTGTLTITGNVAGSGGTSFSATSADIQLLGVISGNGNFGFGGGAGRTVTLGGANTYTGTTGLGATVVAPVLANIGDSSSFGTGTGGGGLISLSGILSYTGAGASTDRPFSFSNGTLSNNGSGALTLTGAVSAPGSLTLGGSYTASDNTVSGVISGAGALTSNGAGTWVLTGANSRSGAVTVQNGTLRAGSAQALGTVTGVTVNGGALDLNNFSLTAQSLTGTGGTLALGSGTLTLNHTSGSTTYAGSITGSSGLTKLGLSTQTLTGASTYSGPTTIGGGTLALSFAPTTGPTSDIISGASTLNMGGGNLTVTGGANENNAQTFNGVNITGGNNNISATSASGGSVTLNLGAINRTGGLVDFDLPTAGSITTTNTALGGWASVNNGSSYAKVVGGNILAFTSSDYVVRDNAATWLDGEFITDDAAGYTGTMDSPDGTLQLGGLRYTAARSTTVTVAGGDTLGIDGAILVAPSVGGFNQTITGGSLTGSIGGGTLGIQQNSTGTVTIASQIVDNGGEIGFTKAGTGLVTLSNTNNTYSGPTVVSQGTLSVASIADGGVASSIGDSSADSSNLVLEGATLRYTGAGATSDRGFTIGRSGPTANSTVEVQNGAANLAFSGQVTSSDGAGLIKTGTGTLTLTNAGNDYTGPTTVNAGTLSVSTLANGGEASSIGASSNASGNLVLGGGTLEYTGGTVTSDRGFTLSTSTSGINVSDPGTTLTLSGTAVGAGHVTKGGAGTLVLSGTNTYTGSTTVSEGTLRAGSTEAFSNNVMNLADTAGVTLDLDGFSNTVGSLAGGGANGGNVILDGATLTLNGANGTYSGTISGTSGVTKGASGTQTMVGCNHAYTGATTISGFLSVDCLRNGGLASGIGASDNAASNLVFNAGTLIYTGGSIGIDRGFTLTGSGAIDVTDGAATLSFSGPVGGTGGLLVKRGPGTLVLSGNNSYTGITLLESGTVRAGSTTAFGTTGIRMDGANTTLDLDGFSMTVAYLHQVGSAANRDVVLDGATLTINSGDGTYSGVISGSGSLVKSVGGTQTLSGCNNSYSGSTRITAGALTVHCLSDGGGNSSIGNASAAASNLYINGALTYVGTGSTTNRQFTMGTAGTVLAASGDGAVNFSSTAPIAIDGTAASRTLTLRGTNTDDNTLAAQINNGSSGLVRVTKTDAGTWVLTNENSAYTGTTRIDAGVLSVSKLANGGVASSIGASTGAAANLVIGNGSTLRYTGAGDATNRQFTLSQGVTFIESSGSGALQFTNTGNVTLSGAGDRTIALGGTNTGLNTMGGTIADAGVNGKTTLAKNDSGTWVLTGNNTYTGNTVVNDGNLIIGNGLTSGNAGSGNVIVDSATSTLSINRSDTFAFNGTLSGPGTLAQIGTGTTRLTSLNNSIGATTINAGTLEVDGALATATIAMTGTSTLNVDGTMQAAGGTAAVLTGDAGASTININSGGMLRANGDMGGGSDVVNVTGTLGTGVAALSLGAGDDIVTLNDGAAITGPGFNGGAAATNDLLVLNNAGALTFNGGLTAGFEQLRKQNGGTATMTGSQTFDAGTTISGGTLDIDGTLTTAAVALAGGTTLNIDGTVQAAGATQTAINGDTGVNTVMVNAGATLLATGTLDAGADVLDVAGMLDTGGGTFSLGDGDDSFVIHDGTNVSGTVDGGAGLDTRVYNINLTADLGALQGFEGLTKTGAGVLNINGPGVSSLAEVEVSGGTLNVTAAGIIDDVASTTVSAGGTLLVNGIYGGTAGNDTFVVTGTVAGTGSIDLDDGDDVLTLRDGVAFNAAIDAGNAVAGDSVVLDNTSALTFDGTNVSSFEELVKQNTGTATLTGTHAYDSATVTSGTLEIDGTLTTSTVDLAGGTLDVDGTLTAGTVALTGGTTLNVDGIAQAAGGTHTAITGDGGVNTLVVSAGAMLLATGDLGDGNDVLDVAGTLDTGGGAFLLGAGNDAFVVHDSTVVTGTLDAGAGDDMLNVNISSGNLAQLGSTTGFESLGKSGLGELEIGGPSDFVDVQVQGGVLDVTATGGIQTQTASVRSGGTLNVDGTLTFTAQGNAFTVAGTVAGTGTIDMLDGDDVLTLRDGAALNMAVDGGSAATNDTVALDSSVALTFDGANTVGFERLVKENTGTATMTGSQTFSAGVGIDGGTLDIDGALTTATVALAGGTTLNVDGTVQAAGATQTDVAGSAGVNAIVVNAGGNLLATGNLGDGSDVLDVAGTLDTGTGTFNLGAGDDSFIIHDGTTVLGTVDGGAGLDTRVYDIAGVANVGALQEFEGLTKRNTGTLTISGPATTTDLLEVAVEGGTLEIDTNGNVTGVTTTTVAAGATFAVDGTYLFTSGTDDFTIAGTVTGSGTVDMLDGDDELTLFDGADLSGLAAPLSGGAGTDTLTADIATSATLGTSFGFETLSKEGAGSLSIVGSAASAFDTVLVQAGVLDVTAGAGVEAQTATVSAGATLNVDGDFLFTAAANTFTVAGAVTGPGSIDMLDGDDDLRLLDGADLSGHATSLEGGAGTDTLTAHIGTMATLGGATGFETLNKEGSGSLVVSGPTASTFDTVLVQDGLLDVTATAGVGAHSATVNAGATMNVDGSLLFTAGIDDFTVAGNVTGLGSIDMLDGDDQLTLLDGADSSGLTTSLDGGAGNDRLSANITTSARLGGATGFETLVKEGIGLLTIAGPASSAFDTVLVRDGTLDVAAGAVVDPQTTAVDAAATMNVDGTYQGTTGDDTFTLSGTLTGTGTIDMLDGDDVLTINTGATVAFGSIFDAAAASADRFVLAGVDMDSFDVSLIDTVFLNFDEFHKQGAGTWRLTGTADASWAVAEGTLIGDSASFGGDIANAATVIFDQAGDGAFTGVLSGDGMLIKQNAGTLVMTGENTFTGDTQVAVGTLQVDGVLPSATTVGAGATLSGIGTLNSVTALAGSSVVPGNPANPFGTLTLLGDYAGTGIVRINAQLSDSSSAASRLAIRGNTTDASSPVIVNRTGGNGAQTTGDGIEIIEVEGASPAGSFRLAQPVEAGAYEYLLYQGGASDANDWYLRSELAAPQSQPDSPPPVPAFRSAVPGYVLGHQIDLEYGFTALGSLRTRVGDQGRVPRAESRTSDDAWMRVYAHELSVAGSRFAAHDLQMSTLHFGADIYTRDAGKASEHFGVMFSVGESSATFYDTSRSLASLATRTGDVDMDVKGGGVYWTRYGANGAHLDLTAQLLHYRNHYRDQLLASGQQNGWGGTVAAELGSSFALGGTGWLIEPQLQLGYQRLELDAFTDGVATISAVEEDGLRARAATQLFRAPDDLLGMRDVSPYLGVGVQHDFRDATAVTIGDTAVRDRIPDTTGDVSAGFTGSVSSGLGLYLDLRYQKSTEGEKDGMRINFGFRMSF